MILAALHDLALSGQAPELAAAFGTSARSAVGITPLEPGAITPPADTGVNTGLLVVGVLFLVFGGLLALILGRKRG